jgi:hypothetical protein
LHSYIRGFGNTGSLRRYVEMQDLTPEGRGEVRGEKIGPAGHERYRS